MRASSLVLVLGVTLCACTDPPRRDTRRPRQEEPGGRPGPAPAKPPEPPPPPPPVRHDPPRPRPDGQTDWAKLGERSVDGRQDVDTILVEGSLGRYTRIKLAVEFSAMELDSVVVTFGDGTTFTPGTRDTIAGGGATRVIDLPGAARTIRSVRFRYANIPGGGRAQVELWAR